jgi:hypothetical protein
MPPLFRATISAGEYPEVGRPLSSSCLRLTVPAGNTPEYVVAFMRRETAHQGALAKLSGHQPNAPQR